MNKEFKLKQIINILKKESKTLTILSTDAADARFLKAKKILDKMNLNIEYLLINKDFIANYEKSKKEKLFQLYKKIRINKGETEEELKLNFNNPNYFSCLLLKANLANGIVSGASHKTADILKPAFQIIKALDSNKPITSFMWLSKKNKLDIFMADVSIIKNPSFNDLANIAISNSKSIKNIFDVEPFAAMLSFSTLGSGGKEDEEIKKIQKATSIVRENNCKVIGEIQWDAAFFREVFEFKTKIKPNIMPNLFVFPNLSAANIGYKIASSLGGYKAVGPILSNIAKPINDLSRGTSVLEIVELVILTAFQALIIEQKREEKNGKTNNNS